MLATQPAHVTVCILTFKRPELLARCLRALANQSRGDFTYSVVVVDNDSAESGRRVAMDWAARQSVKCDYLVEPEQNIAGARNRAISSSLGDYVAFIDDDESASADWLRWLIETCRNHAVDGVLGPVLPEFEGQPGRWLERSRLHDRRAFSTGERMTNARYMRTGNVLLSRRMFDGLAAPFDLRFGLSGGEDSDFFARMLGAGRSFVWCNEAWVREWIPKERQTLNYHLRRALLRGASESRLQRKLSFGTFKSIVAIGLYGLLLPLLLVFRYDLFAKYLVKWCDHAGKLMAHCGVHVTWKRTF